MHNPAARVLYRQFSSNRNKLHFRERYKKNVLEYCTGKNSCNAFEFSWVITMVLILDSNTVMTSIRIRYFLDLLYIQCCLLNRYYIIFV